MRARPEHGALRECPDCGLLQVLPEEHPGGVLCERCDAHLASAEPRPAALLFVCASLGLVLGAIALVAPLAGVSMQWGRSAVSDIFTGPEMLHQSGAWELGVVVVLTLLLAPAAKLFGVLFMSARVPSRRFPRWVRRFFALVPALSRWAMVEVFILGAVIALVRLDAWMHVDFGPALLALAGVAMCSLAMNRCVNTRALWVHVPEGDSGATTTGAWSLVACHACRLVTDVHRRRCERCFTELCSRKPQSVSRTWALIVAGALLTIPANILPVMIISKLGKGGASTILGGTGELLERGFWGLAALVFVASVLVPLFKLVVLSILAVSVARGTETHLKLRTRLYRVVEGIGRWSMLDIFATMMLVALARFGWVGSVVPGVGATAFCAVVIVTMLAAQAFDPRLMWDAAGKNVERRTAAEAIP